MATTFNENEAQRETLVAGVHRRRLLDRGRVPHTRVLIDRLTFAAGATLDMHVGASDLAWLQVLEGEAAFVYDGGQAELSSTHLAFLPPGFAGRLESATGAAILHAQVPDATAFDPQLVTQAPGFHVVDWAREPVLDSEHDARKRIYVATPKLFGTTAIKGEMIVYPPGTQAANHHHEGAEHFMYVLKGGGTAYANEQPLAVRKGDLIYYEDRERHYLRAHNTEEMVFVEFFVPGRFKTVWAPGAAVCTWNATGRTIRGEVPAREIRSHSGAFPTPQDV